MSASKNKGDGFERELAHYLSDALGLKVTRTPLSGGGMTSRFGPQMADLTGTPDIWVEAKRTETFRPREAMAQALKGLASQGSPDMPVIVNRQNRQKTGEGLAVLRFDDFIRLYRGYLISEGILDGPDSRTPAGAGSDVGET